ncbi:ABC transporter permease subunit [Streptomyces xinghaiensis]|uniref:ABC transporter permease n=1 Tax=Streptomyces xinghaiensis TaxID=1038928 RepID=UPI0002E109B1|nr:ABC transporter permease [Streptomyces sp. SID5475]
MSTNLTAAVAKGLSGRNGKQDGKRERRRLSYPVVLLIIAGVLLLLSVLRAWTGAGDLTSSGQYGGALIAAVPIGLAGLGGLWAERAGVINIGLEGMMMLGTFCAGWAGYQYGPWAAALAGVIGGLLGGLIHAIATVSFGVDHIISGVAINILALGVTQYLAKLLFGAEGSEAAAAGGNDKQSPPMDDMSTFSVPLLSDGLGTLEKKDWFLLSDAAGILRGLTTNVSWLTLVAAGLFVGTFFVLWRSSFGLRLRSCGENPTAAESLGVNVYTYKYAALLVSGGLAGLGGAFMAIGVHFYSDGQTGGRGYIGLATMIFGNWRPGGVAMGAGLFGFMDSLQLRGGGDTVHALLLLAVVLLVAVTLWKLRATSRRTAAISAVFAVLLVLWYAFTETVPREFVEATPYVATLLVLALAAQRLRPPKAIGRTYQKGQGK